MNVGEPESRAGGDDVEDRVLRVRGHAKSVQLLPRADACFRRIRVRALLRQIEAPLLRARFFFECEACSVICEDLLPRTNSVSGSREHPGHRAHRFFQPHAAPSTNALGGACRALFSKTTLATPVTSGIVQIRMCWEVQCDTLPFRALKAALAAPVTA